ncbi:MAG: hypothetical protein FWC09_09720 [Lachnospiraceae bacterium]|nr:hypothetical protein [Lachnospiraceae bacterium]
MKKIIYSALFLLLSALLLIHPKESLDFALNGLNLWFQKMVPTLFPFMILSGMMVRMNLTDKLVLIVKPLLKPLFQLRGTAIYTIAVGFLCGFPMGARVTADLYERRQLSKEEAAYLLAFTNNIGPIYFISFALPIIGVNASAPLFFGMYGIPLIYGFILRYTFYCEKITAENYSYDLEREPAGLAKALDDSITVGIEGITKLGGYMIIFNLLNIIPYLFITADLSAGILSGMLEITGGLTALKTSSPIISLVLITFGGLSCFAQTFSCISKTDLSIRNYIIHKLILTAITVGYYLYVL